MRESLYIGATGMKALADGMNVITNNLANISTIGFKQQDAQFADIWYSQQANMGDWWCAQEDSRVALGQKGHGVLVNEVRTIYQQGALESSNTVTDLALNGSGFFQVTDAQGNAYYTRAGDFRPDNQGVWRNPEGLALMGNQYVNGKKGALAPVTVDKFAVMKPKATTSLSMTFNVSQGQDNCANEAAPYFSLLKQFNGESDPPISSLASSYSQGVTLYDAQGQPHTATIYFDGAPSAKPGSVVEFLIAADAEKAQGAGAASAAKALMSGTLTFNAQGQIVDMAAYTPTAAGSADLADWSVARLSTDGLPVMDFNGSAVSVDLGIRAPKGWQGGGTAADVGASQDALASMGNAAVVNQAAATTNYMSSSPVTQQISQDGYPEGFLSNISVERDGTVVGRFSNSQTQELWQIPVCRFTSEYNLRREGNNLFSATAECGQMEMGVAGTENYAKMEAYNIEHSNVDMASEMVDMIITQRGFQSNSKVVTTSDEMLRRAIDLKR